MLSGAQWAPLEPLIEACRPKGKSPPRTCGAPSRPSCSDTIMEPSGGLFPRSWGPWWGRLGALAEPYSRARHPTRDGVSRRHECAVPSEGGRGSPKGGSQAERDDCEALGRSRGGYGTKACVMADASERAIAFRIAPGQDSASLRLVS